MRAYDGSFLSSSDLKIHIFLIFGLPKLPDGSFLARCGMLTDVAIKALKSKEKDYKVADRDGMHVHVTTKGALSFRIPAVMAAWRFRFI
jgi:hypothetical protein